MASSNPFDPGSDQNAASAFDDSWTGWNLTPSGDQTGGYYDPWSTYGGSFGSQYDPNAFSNTAIGRWYLSQNQDPAWARYVAPIIGGGNSNFDAWVQSQKGRVMDAYQAALATNPNLDLYGQFLPGLGGYDQWMQRYLSMMPGERGEQTGTTAGQARWVPRL